MEPTEGKSREALKEQANAWKTRLHARLDKLLVAHGDMRAEVFDVLWQSVLERSCPTDEQEKQARIAFDKDVYHGTRDEGEPYLRIMYSAAYYKEPEARNWTSIPKGYVTSPISEVFWHFVNRIQEHQGDYDKVFGVEKQAKSDPLGYLADEIIKRAKAEVVKRGSTPTIIPFGAEGTYKGIPVKVDRYTGDGGVVLRAGSYDDHQKLFDVSPDKSRPGVVPPTELDVQNFNISAP